MWGKVEIPHTSQPGLLAIIGDSRQTIALIPSVVRDVYSQRNLHIHLFLHCSYRSYPCSSPVPSPIKMGECWGMFSEVSGHLFPLPFFHRLPCIP